MHFGSARYLYYFDILGGVVAIGIIARGLSLGRAGITSGTILALVAFLVALACVLVWRVRAYRQPVPWIAGAYAVTALLLLILLFWALPTVWFAAALGAGSAALVCGMVMRTKPLAEAITRTDVFRLISIPLSILLAVGTSELVLRLAPGLVGQRLRPMLSADPRQYGISHDYIGYLHRPNGAPVVEGLDFKAIHRVDALGFRNPWPWPESPDIVVVGDSVTFGWGASEAEAWPTILARALPEHPLVNLALIGAGPQQYLRVYETFGIERRPKLLLVGVFGGNDFWDAEAFDLWLKSGVGGNYMVWRDFGRPGPPVVSWSDPRGTLNSAFDRYVYPAMRTSRLYNLMRAIRESGGDPLQPSANVQLADGGQLRLVPAEHASRAAMGAKHTRSFQLAFDAFSGLHATAATSGTRVLMVLLPSKEEAYLPRITRDVPDLTRDLRAAFERRGIDYLDLAPAFRAHAAAGERLFLQEDGHPNPKGYALMADLIMSHLVAHRAEYGLVEPLPASDHSRAEPRNEARTKVPSPSS
jgi:lysophospholipase L1-like esterase